MIKKITNIGISLTFVAIGIMIYQIVGIGVFGAGYSFSSAEYYESHSLMFDSISLFLLLAIFSAWVYRLSSQSKSRIHSEKIDKRMIGSLLIVALGLNGISGLWFAAVEMGLDKLPVIGQSMQNHNSNWQVINNEAYIWTFLSVVLIGPIVEELLFRGLIFHYLERIKSGWFPILISGIAFGIWHQEPVQCVYASVIGIAFGLVYARTRNLFLVMMMHIIINLMSALPPFMNTEAVRVGTNVICYIMVLPSILILVQLGRNKNQLPVSTTP